jgi:ribosomal protein L29
MKTIKKLSVIISFALLSMGAAAQSDLRQLDVNELQDMLENIQNIEGIPEHISDALGQFGDFLETAGTAIDLYNASQALDNNECVPDFTTDASAMMPTGCADNAGCQSCYQSAISRMNTVRKSLARLSCINSNTKAFVEAAIAFGDNVSGIHGVMGLAWQHERQGIRASYEKFKDTYDKKYVDLINSLQTALQEINRCEAQYGIRDWYQKFGFIYFEMMKEKYKRTE